MATILVVVGLVVAVLGVALSGPVWNRIAEARLRRRRQISWKNFDDNLRSPEVKAAIELEGRPPDLILGINSGIVPAAILAFNYQIANLRYVLCMPHYDASGRRLEDKVDLMDGSIAGKYVLLVDDQYYSGESMKSVREAVEKLPGADAATIKSFAVYAYDTPTRPVHLDIQPPGRVSGVLSRAPWAFSDMVQRHYMTRGRSSDRPNTA